MIQSAPFPIPRQPQYPSIKGVTTVNDDVGSGHEHRGVGGKENSKTVQVVNGTKAVLWGERLPDLLLGIKGGDVVESSVHITCFLSEKSLGICRRRGLTWGDAVDTNAELSPLSSQRLAKLDDTSL